MFVFLPSFLMTLSHRFISTLTIGSIALSATPAFAYSVGLGGSANVGAGISAGVNTKHVDVDTHTNADVKASSSVKLAKMDKGDDLKNGRWWYGTGSTVHGSGATVARLENKVDKSLSLAARVVAAFSKKICAVLGNSNGTSLTTCMADQKAKIKAAFSLKLDAAFGN